MATGKAGSITVTLKFKPDATATGRNSVSSAQIEVESSVTSKAPKQAIPRALFFGTVEGELLRDDPDQRPIFGDAEDRAQRQVGD